MERRKFKLTKGNVFRIVFGVECFAGAAVIIVLSSSTIWMKAIGAFVLLFSAALAWASR
jgi:hypothetical protein